MSYGKKVNVFVSSTCYDLSQIRVDVKEFIGSMGFEPVLSEMDSFPINPDKNTVENCLNAVRTKADIFVLVVGNRYGSVVNAGKSITNLEYVEAKARGIPCYIFLKQEIIHYLPVWQKNKDGDFSDFVDSPSLFEFASSLWSAGGSWVFSFSSAQDIVRVLSTQFSHLVSESLNLRMKLQSVDQRVLSFSPEALRIFIEKDDFWEHLLFARLIQEKVLACRKKKLDIELGLAVQDVSYCADTQEVVGWLRAKLRQIVFIVGNINKIFDRGLAKAFGEPGIEGDVERIEHAAYRFGDVYEQLLDWALSFNSIEVSPDVRELVRITSSFADKVIENSERFAMELYGNLSHVIENHEPGDTVEMVLTLDLPDTSPFYKELDRLTELETNC